jgi:hypothetical protein
MPLMPSFSRFACAMSCAGHLRIGPTEHRHHLALGAIGIGSNLRAGLAHTVAALLWLVDAGEDRVFFNFAAHAFLFIGTTRPRTILQVNTLPQVRGAKTMRITKPQELSARVRRESGSSNCLTERHVTVTERHLGEPERKH